MAKIFGKKINNKTFNSNNVMLSITKAWNMAFHCIFGLQKFDSTRLLLKNCTTMSAKVLLHRNILMFHNNVSNCNVPFIYNLWCWFNSGESCKSFLLKYGLSDVNSRCVIHVHHAVAAALYTEDVE